MEDFISIFNKGEKVFKYQSSLTFKSLGEHNSTIVNEKQLIPKKENVNPK